MLDALKGLSEAEREYALKILQEIGQGSTNTLNDLKYADYKEPPVDIETFILDEKYLGKAWHTASGKLKLFPYWLEKLKQLFPDNLTTNVNNAIFSGARGLGKSEIAVTCLLYMMHRVMCMENARDLLNIKPTEKICFAMMNITKTLAEDIAVSKFQNTVQLSPWFLERGTMTQKNNSPYWTPPDPIDVIVGSQPSHVIGQPIYACLDGDTIINTVDGDFPIKELDNKSIKVYNTDDNGNLVLSDECIVKLTKETCEEYQIELEDGTVIKCTPEHRFMLINGEYKQAQELTTSDNIRVKIKKITHIIHEEPKQYYDVINAFPYNNFLIKTNTSYVVSHNCFFDEISFIRNQDIDRQKQIALDMIDTAIGGMKTRFLQKGQNPTLLILASSKRSEKSFLEEHMKKKLSDEGEAKNTLIVDEPVWNIRPSSDYSGKRFNVAVGNKFLPSEVIPLDADVDEWRAKGYRVIEVPIEFKSDFLMEIDRALCDFAGISSSDLTKYISGTRLNACRCAEIQNLFTKDVIEVGDGKDDTTQYYDFIDLSRLDKDMKSKPLYIHFDMSISGDCTGIGGVFMIGKRTGGNDDAREMYYQTAFNVSVKAPKGHQVSMAKNRRLIYWLKEQGFNVKGISSDTFGRSGIEQEFLSRGYDYQIISVDRVNNNRVCEPYAYFKNTIYEERIRMYKSDKLENEIVNLERDGNTGKIDHPEHGAFGAKDASDAICGALWNASLHAQEFSYEFGEDDINTIVDTSMEISDTDLKKQVQIDFENELKRAAQEQAQHVMGNSQGTDFGWGRASDDWAIQQQIYNLQGILV